MMVSQFTSGFVLNEALHHDTIGVKRAYVEMTGNPTDAILLSQIMYWHGVSKETGKERLKIEREGHKWLAKGHADWWEETAINEHTAKRAINRLKKAGVIETRTWKFNNAPTTHIRIVWDVFYRKLFEVMRSNPNRYNCPDGIERIALNQGIEQIAPIQQSESLRSITETTHTDYETENISGTPDMMPNPYQQMIDAIKDAFKTSDGFAKSIEPQLTGRAKKGSRADWALDDAMTPADVLGFGIWYRDRYDRDDLPTTAETLHDRVLEYRGAANYQTAKAKGEARLKELYEVEDDSPQGDDSDLADPNDVAAVFDEIMRQARENHS